jgi:hypothetical protein
MFQDDLYHVHTVYIYKYMYSIRLDRFVLHFFFKLTYKLLRIIHFDDAMLKRSFNLAVL